MKVLLACIAALALIAPGEAIWSTPLTGDEGDTYATLFLPSIPMGTPEQRPFQIIFPAEGYMEAAINAAANTATHGMGVIVLHNESTVIYKGVDGSKLGDAVMIASARAFVSGVVPLMSSSTGIDLDSTFIVGYGAGAHFAMNYGSAGLPCAGVIAYDPPTAGNDISSLFEGDASFKSPLLVVLPYEGLQPTAFEASLDAAAPGLWEMSVISGTKALFNVMGSPNYDAAASMRLEEVVASFIDAQLEGGEKGTTKPVIAELSQITRTDVTYSADSLQGAIIYDPATATAQQKQPAVVFIPAWSGHGEHEILRQYQMAEQGYVTFSANIYGQDIGVMLDGDARMANTSFYRPFNAAEADADAAGRRFTARIQSAVDYVRSLDYVDGDNIAVIGFCFGGTGAYNMARYETDAKIAISMHGNMMTTRPRTEFAGASIGTYVMMQSGGNDGGESNESMLAHLSDLTTGGASWELARYANVDHGFTDWGAGSYNPVAEGRAFKLAFSLLEDKMPVAEPVMTLAELLASSADHTILASVAPLVFPDALSGDGPLTVFAPTDYAFKSFAEIAQIDLADLSNDDMREALTAIVSFHVVAGKTLSSGLSEGMSISTLLEGETLTFNVNQYGQPTLNPVIVPEYGGAIITHPDIEASNGVVHVIDQVLVPAALSAGDGGCDGLSIYQCAQNSDEHSILIAAIEAAGLVDALNGTLDGLTLFAPTNDAFARAFEALNVTADEVLQLPELGDILKYHVLGMMVTSETFTLGVATAPSFQGAIITMAMGEEGAFVNNAPASMEAIDIMTTNGVIHVVTEVLIPPFLLDALLPTEVPATLLALAESSADHTTLVAAVKAAGLESVLTTTGPPNGQSTVFAPTNTAFDDLLKAVPGATIDDVVQLSQLSEILKMHVLIDGKVWGAVAQGIAPATLTMPTAASDNLIIQYGADKGVYLSTADVPMAATVTASLEAVNGMVHVIDTVLLPPSVKAEIVAELTAAVAARAGTAAPTAAPVAADTAAPVAAPATTSAKATAKVDGLPDDFETNDNAKAFFISGIATLVARPSSDITIDSISKVTAARHLLASTFDIEYTIANIPPESVSSVTTSLKDTVALTTALQGLGSGVSVASAGASEVVTDTSAAAHFAGSVVAVVLALFALLA